MTSRIKLQFQKNYRQPKRPTFPRPLPHPQVYNLFKKTIMPLLFSPPPSPLPPPPSYMDHLTHPQFHEALTWLQKLEVT